ncbi:MAG: AMP-binding protein [Inquilinus sp.]|nr:AMP-binding protein [Inquilinus sp.]
MLTRGRDYDETRAQFRWRLPGRYNIGIDAVDQHADGGGRPALILVGADGAPERYSFDDLKARSDRLANAFAAHAEPGARVAILLPQSLEAALAHIAAYKAGMVALPLFTLFGEEALEYRLTDSGAGILVTDRDNWPKVAAIRDRLPGFRLVLVTGTGVPPTGTEAFDTVLAKARPGFAPVATGPDDPALLIYTSGTTGPPKGALHAHRVLLGHLPGVEFPHDFPPQPGDLFWTPADWAWIGGLLDVLLPAWHHGLPVLGHRMAKFDPDRAYALMAEHKVRNVFLPPTALKLLRQAGQRRHRGLRSIGSGGETLGAELLDWGRATFGLTIHEFYGQTECNLVVGNNASQFPVRPGAMGRAIPGHEVAVVGDRGDRLAAGEIGQIAVRRRTPCGIDDPVMFLGYWNNPAATEAKFVAGAPGDGGDWLLTGDTGRRDDDGTLWFVGRDDDVITSAGYRIGPAEIEDCLMKHPAVALAAAIGVPDPIRTEIVKACIVLRTGESPNEALKQEIRGFVKTRLAAHEYPRLVEFVDALPMTATGKIIRKALRDAPAPG